MRVFAHFIQEIDAYEDQDRNRKQQQIDLLAVKQRDHQNRPKSSATARAVRKILSEIGTRSLNIERMPMAKAMSVAVGIPQPGAATVPALNEK